VRRLGQATAAAASLALCAAIASCGGGSDPGTASFDLTIGNLVPLRGALAGYGPAGRKAVALAVREADRAAAGTGVGVRVRNADTETSDLIAEVLARKLIEDDGASCLAGDWSANGTFGVAGNVAIPEDVPLISPASSSAELSEIDDRGLVLRTAPSDDLQAIALARLAARSLGGARGRTLSIGARDDLYGRRFSQLVGREWRRLGGRAAAPVRYDPGRLHHRAEARRLTAGSPDAYVIVDFPDGFSRLAPDLLATGRFDPARLFLPDVLALDDSAAQGIPAAAVQGARGTLPGAVWHGPEGRWFNRLFGHDPSPPPRQAGFDAQAFDAATLCFLGAVAAGSDDGGAIKGSLREVSGPPGARLGPAQLGEAVRALRAGREIDYQGASGPIDFDTAGDPTAAEFGVYTYRGGRARTTGSIAVRR
jgi:branched-chain amino acid transport system substrate-binding protein